MIRVLVMIAVAGFLLSIVSLSTAAAIGGPEAIARGGWNWASGHDWDWDSHRGNRRHWTYAGGPEETRDFTWRGGDRLEVDLPADVTYTQAAGPAKLTITGPQGALDEIQVDDGQIRFDHGMRHAGRLTIALTAPDIRRFELNGANRLTIENYRQDRLEVELSGDTELVARGETRELQLEMSGSSNADLGGLKAAGAKVELSGAGEATIAPSEWADLEISGAGEVTLLTNPPKLQTDISGSGAIHQGGPITRSPSDSPSPSPSPGKKT